MNKLLNIPMIIFLVAFITLIVVLIVITNKKQKKYKQTIEKLDYEKNKLIGVPILSELSKVKELVKTEDLKQKPSDWDETFKDIKVGDIVIVYNEYSHDYEEHKIKIDSIEYSKEYINKKYNPKGMRFYGIDLSLWDSEIQDYINDDYISVVTEGNFVCIV